MQAHLAHLLSHCLQPLPSLCCRRVAGIASAETRAGAASLSFAKPGACVAVCAQFGKTEVGA